LREIYRDTHLVAQPLSSTHLHGKDLQYPSHDRKGLKMLVFADTKNIHIQSATLDLDKEKKIKRSQFQQEYDFENYNCSELG
jgi:hypothetical protein